MQKYLNKNVHDYIKPYTRQKAVLCVCVHVCMCFLAIVSSVSNIVSGIPCLSLSSVTQPCPTLCSPPHTSVHGISQARVWEWVAISSSRGSSWLRDWTLISCVSCIDWWILSSLSHLGSSLTYHRDSIFD